MGRTIRTLSFRILALVLAVGCLGIRPASAATQGGIDLRRTKYFVDQNTRVWLSVHLANAGSQPVTILGIAPAKSGPWTKVGQTAAPGTLVRCAMPAPDGGAKAVWVSTPAGLLDFELPATH